MVKPDVKHNYYSDLDLPTTATIDDIRRSYHKLALQYHPDRNAGRETDCVPRFQAIQAAHEILGDPAIKAKYDQDRRKAGLYPPGRPNTPNTGNPYQATTDFPPPPRRTQAGGWQRPNPAPTAPRAPPPTGAERFNNVPRPNGASPRRDPAADRAQQFRAWQNMNTASERPKNFGTPGTAPPPQAYPNATSSRRPPPPPPPPPRADNRMPTEEQIRAGMNYRRPPSFDADYAEDRRSAWQAFQQNKHPARDTPPPPPRRPGGFDPNAPGSDERPAPEAGRHYHRRNRTEETFAGHGDDGYADAPGSKPESPVSPTSQRPFRKEGSPENIPYTEGYRKSTPYSAFLQEKTRLSTDGLPDGLRRSASTQNATKLQAEKNAAAGRARSNSPMGRKPTAQDEQSKGRDESFDSRSPDNEEHSRQNRNEPMAGEPNLGRSGTAPLDRPRKTPKAPSARFNTFSETGRSTDHDSQKGTQLNGEQPEMRSKQANGTMYATSSFLKAPSQPRFCRETWATNAFGPSSVQERTRKTIVPNWAVPSSIMPQEVKNSAKLKGVGSSTLPSGSAQTDPSARYTDESQLPTHREERAAMALFCSMLDRSGFHGAQDIDMATFFEVISAVCQGHLPNNPIVCAVLIELITAYPSLFSSPRSPKPANNVSANSFTVPAGPHKFEPTQSKSRSQENVDTQFSPESWNGTFTGSSEYFPPSDTRRKPSPGRRPGRNSPQRSATLEATTPSDSSAHTVPPRPFGSDGAQVYPPPPPNGPSFSKQEWEKTFQDSSWTWSQPTSGQSTAANRRTQSKSAERKANRSQSPTKDASQGNRQEDSHLRLAGGVPVAEPDSIDDVPISDGDAMDIDHTPPTRKEHAATMENEKGPSEPAPAWREQQQTRPQQPRRDPPAVPADEPRLDTSLDDLRHVEPIAQEPKGLKSFADMGSALPFVSQASQAPPTLSLTPEKLPTPPVPKAPEPPQKLARVAWQEYCTKFGLYVQAFHDFNRKMLAHFEARETQSEADLQYGMGWLEAGGDKVGIFAGAKGFGSYFKAVREDEYVREVWNVGWERHADNLAKFNQLRERVRVLSAGGALIEG